MITIQNTEFTSNISLVNILLVLTKVQMLDICKKLDLYVSPNLKKEETARRVADELLHSQTAILCSLCKQDYELLDELIKGGPNHYVVRKMRKTPYKLQKYALVLTYEDFEKDEWHILMPDCVRTALATRYLPFLDMVQRGVRIPSAKELRMTAALNDYFGDNNK